MIISIRIISIRVGSDREGDRDQIIQTPWINLLRLTHKYNGNASNYDALILKLLPEKHHYEKADLRDCFISVILFLY
jgi:dGTPase